MPTFIMLTRISHADLRSPGSLETAEKKVKDRIKAECPGVKWIDNFVVFGPYDYLDVFEAPDLESASKVAMIVRIEGNGQTETWPALAWSHFKDVVHDIV